MKGTTILMIFSKLIQNITSPTELLNYMDQNFHYNYDADIETYHLQSPEETLKCRSGICFDMVEFERYWFESYGYEVKTYFEMVPLDYENPYPTHSFLIYKDEDEWCLFEVADERNIGIYTCENLNELLDFQLKQYLLLLRSFDIQEDELCKVIQVEFNKPNFGETFYDYVDEILTLSEEI